MNKTWMPNYYLCGVNGAVMSLISVILLYAVLLLLDVLFVHFDITGAFDIAKKIYWRPIDIQEATKFLRF